MSNFPAVAHPRCDLVGEINRRKNPDVCDLDLFFPLPTPNRTRNKNNSTARLHAARGPSPAAAGHLFRDPCILIAVFHSLPGDYACFTATDEQIERAEFERTLRNLERERGKE